MVAWNQTGRVSYKVSWWVIVIVKVPYPQRWIGGEGRGGERGDTRMLCLQTYILIGFYHEDGSHKDIIESGENSSVGCFTGRGTLCYTT